MTEAIVLTKMKNTKRKSPLTSPSKQLGRCKTYPSAHAMRRDDLLRITSSLEVALCRTLVKIQDTHAHIHKLALGCLSCFMHILNSGYRRNVFVF